MGRTAYEYEVEYEVLAQCGTEWHTRKRAFQTDDPARFSLACKNPPDGALITMTVWKRVGDGGIKMYAHTMAAQGPARSSIGLGHPLYT